MGRYGNFRQIPALYNMNHLEELRERGDSNVNVKLFLKDVERIVQETPVTIMDRKRTFAPDAHYYCSISRYSWPSKNNPTIYEIRDGQTNPEFNDFNRPNIDELSYRLKALCVAFYITQKDKYYNAFCKQLKAWFVDKSTYMKPCMEYAQVVQGHNNNRGAAYGLVDLNQFTPVIESVFLVKQQKDIDEGLDNEIKLWFSSMLGWVLNDKRWKQLLQKPNNIVSSLYVCFLEMARYTGNLEEAESLVKEYTDVVLNTQIEEDGKQPAELRRASGFGYSVSNLVNIVDFCLITEQMGIHYYKDNQKKIDSAFTYLMQFIGNHEAFPYMQTGNWEWYERMFERNMSRLGKLSSQKSKVKRTGLSINVSEESVLNYVY